MYGIVLAVALTASPATPGCLGLRANRTVAVARTRTVVRGNGCGLFNGGIFPLFNRRSTVNVNVQASCGCTGGNVQQSATPAPPLYQPMPRQR